MTVFFEYLATFIEAVLEDLEDHAGLLAEEVHEMAFEWESDGIWCVTTPPWLLFLWDVQHHGDVQVYARQTLEGFCYPGCRCSWCEGLREVRT